MLLQTHWKPSAVAVKTHCYTTTTWRWEQNLLTYRTLDAPRYRYTYLSTLDVLSHKSGFLLI